MVIAALIFMVFMLTQVALYGLGNLLSNIVFPCCVLFAIAFWGMLFCLVCGLILFLLGLVIQCDGILVFGTMMLYVVPFSFIFCIAMFVILCLMDVVGEICFFFMKGWVPIEIEHLFYPWIRMA